MNLQQKPASRLYYCNALCENQVITLNSEDHHHLINVLKLQAEDVIAIFNEYNGEWLATLTEVTKKSSKALILKQIKLPIKNQAKIHLFYAPLKHNPSSILLEKITEIGVTDITQVITQNTTNKPIEVAKAELKVKEASQQCERLSIPKVYATQNLSSLLATLTTPLIWLNEQHYGENLTQILADLTTADNNKIINLLVGPEGGFTKAECELLLNHNKVMKAYLAGNILRAETAAIVAVALSVYNN